MPYQQIDLSGLKSRLSQSQINLAESSMGNPIDNTILEVQTAPHSPYMIGSNHRNHGLSFSPRLATVLGVFGFMILTVGLALNLPNGTSSASVSESPDALYEAVTQLKIENEALQNENIELKQKYREVIHSADKEAKVVESKDTIKVTETKDDKEVTEEAIVPTLTR
jgi:hypothetical protein